MQEQVSDVVLMLMAVFILAIVVVAVLAYVIPMSEDDGDDNDR